MCVCAHTHKNVFIFCTIACGYFHHPIMLSLVVQQYDLERLKKDADAEKEREATLLEDRWGQG